MKLPNYRVIQGGSFSQRNNFVTIEIESEFDAEGFAEIDKLYPKATYVIKPAVSRSVNADTFIPGLQVKGNFLE